VRKDSHIVTYSKLQASAKKTLDYCHHPYP